VNEYPRLRERTLRLDQFSLFKTVNREHRSLAALEEVSHQSISLDVRNVRNVRKSKSERYGAPRPAFF
jgi:hypothetical protein